MTKLELIERLIKENKITFCEALILNQTEKEYITVPYEVDKNPFIDSTWIYKPYQVTCNTGLNKNYTDK